MPSDYKSKILHDAERYVMHGKIPQAISEYLKIVKNDPGDVLTLNTVGDLYLRQGKTLEANKYFSQVAESYTRNNFLLKAIAVYKKILNADPDSLATNQILASLFEKQGLNVDARNQYLRVAALFVKEGKTKESLEAYQKVVALDPMNYAVQSKLAEIYLAEGIKDRAATSFAAAARAEAKAGKLATAVNSYKRAMQLNPLDAETLRGFLEASIQLSDLSEVTEQLQSSLAMAPQEIVFRELLGLAYLAARDAENAALTFQTLLSLDDSRYSHFFALSKLFVELQDYDQAAQSIDSIVPILITKREAERAAEAYNFILQANPGHLLSLVKLTEIYSAINDQVRCLDALDRVATYHVDKQSPRDALEYLERILQIDPGSERHLKMHQQAFAEAYPDSPYRQPVPVVEVPRDEIATTLNEVSSLGQQSGAEESVNPTIVEIDLLLNYGLVDKALSLLLSLEAQDPADKEVRTRLLSLYRDTKKSDKAAEQCLLLAALHRKAHNEESATKFLNEARKLAPDFADSHLDLAAFAGKHGISTDGSTVVAEARPDDTVSTMEVDLSGDLSEIFFKEGIDSGSPEETEEIDRFQSKPDSGVEEYTRMPKKPPTDSVHEQLQEVDFYTRLGFFDEARSKLDEIAKEFPDHPELDLRYRQLDEGISVQESLKTEARGPAGQDSAPAAETTVPDQRDTADQYNGGAIETFPTELLVNRAHEFELSSGSLTGEKLPHESEETSRAQASMPASEGRVNAMFADLIDEVNSLTDQDIAQEDFETHFSLGIAYREMDLIDEAIREFQGAVKTVNPAKSPREVIQCCGMLSTCFLEKGMPRSAIRWCQTGLSVTEVSPHEAMAFRYDLGIAHALMGEPDQALRWFSQIFVIDPGYRDVAQRIDALKGQS